MSEQMHERTNEKIHTTGDRDASDVEEVFTLAFESLRRLEDVEETLRGRLDPVMRPDIGLSEILSEVKPDGAALVVREIREIDARVSAVELRLRAVLARLSV